MIPIQHFQILGLDRHEVVLLMTLYRDGRQSVADLSVQTEIPRMTTYDTLKRLQQRGFARTVRVGKRTEWKANDPAKLQSRINAVFDGIKQMLEPENKAVVLEQIDAKDAGIHVFRGKHQIQRAYASLFAKGSPSGTIRTIDGGGFFYDYFAHISELESELSFARSVRAAGAIIEGVMTSSNLAALKEAALPREVYQEMFAAPISLREIPDRRFAAPIEVSLFGDVATILTPKKLQLMLIRQPELVSAMDSWYSELVRDSTQLNTYDFLQELLEQNGE